MTVALLSADRRQRLKLLAIPVLAFVLFRVVMDDEDASAPPPVALTGDQPSIPGSVGRPRASGNPSFAGPDLELDEILAHDPFAVPPALLPPEPVAPMPAALPPNETTEPVSVEVAAQEQDRTRARLELLSQKRVSVIYCGPSGRTAVIDGKSYREGDELAAGVRIVEIRPDGVLIEVQEPL
jgi:hypothetical protein